ncbi:hypothetical protein COLO4_02065 [Corchorus olitorius]|uniref:Shedu protein SduA C-terminal domain-containing protein n=1 Tax=Corchorus olitorius TaxID=93759 RepID=A0A1R3L1I8_9ROSI|nr:hypothetical protein COLO4_02065 [Corchorus olitorius]
MMVKFLLLLFPKYILVIENITIPDYYSTPGKKTSRFIDIGLVDSNGNLDIIEVKKPFDNKILRRTEYRGNSIPTSELSGGIMQAEKYLFHLSKWGIKGEDKLTKTYKHTLPSGVSIHISNPKAIIIVGRDQIDNATLHIQRLRLTSRAQPVHCIPHIETLWLSIITGGGALENRFATGLWRRQPAADARE